MTSELTLLLNPTAGRGPRRPRRHPRPPGRRFPVRTVLGHAAADALPRAREAAAAGTGALVAVGEDGGDGTISRV
ncbi:hypothetical protein [Streptomyces sp. NBC_00250]|uniref:hypothetical protein n=1 Tax=Streptomyces sp. NBC_00250 TaxID=2903641 RepID=UPI003FA7C3D0